MRRVKKDNSGRDIIQMCLKQFVSYLPLPSMEIYNEQQIPHCSKTTFQNPIEKL